MINEMKMTKTMFKTITLTLTAVGTLMFMVSIGQTKDPLLFPKDNFTVETKTVKTSLGEKKVTYRSYMHIPYVAKPVDKDYQSLNVSVPVSIDGVQVNTANAPIVFVIGVGGYMSVRNVSSNVARPEGEMGAPPAGAPGMGPRDGGPGKMPGGMPPRGGRPGGMGAGSDRGDLALTAGYVVVSPGCRGRDNKAADGTYYGKAPAVIVDLKAAVRYIRHNKGILPGNTEQIVSVGCSAGGAVSAVLGASGNSPLYESYLKEIGAADGRDDIYACACYSPITDLEHADGAYEWMYGNTPGNSGLVDQELSKQLKALNAEYQSSLHLQGKNGFGSITADNYGDYLLQYYLVPSANKFLKGMTDEKRKEYLAANNWINWKNDEAKFSFKDYVASVGRMKNLPAFDDFENQKPEPSEFGNATVNTRHFTDFSLRHSSGNANATLEPEVIMQRNMMNPMYFVSQRNSGCAIKWWLRNGTRDNDTSQPIMVNLATSLENNLKRDVNAWDFWDAGHCQDNDPDSFIAWIGQITGHSK